MNTVGTMVALASPMDAAGRVDRASFQRMLDFQLAGGVDGVVVGGTTGESATLTVEELSDLIRTARAHLPESVSVIAGSGSNSTQRAADLTRLVFEAGADGAMVVTPFYNKPTQGGLVRHYEAVADAALGPVLLYNVPSRTACDMHPSTVAELAQHERIVAVKEAVADMQRLRELRERCGDQLAVLSGDDGSLIDALEVGVDGTVSVTANVAPKAMAQMVALGRGGNLGAARKIDDRLRKLHAALFVESNPIAVKWALTRLGVIDGPDLRLPLTPLDGAHEALLDDALRTAGLH